MDDRRAGLVLRALRLRRGWRQADLAAHAGVSQSTASRAERGHLRSLTLERIGRLYAALEARAGIDIRWRGGELDRLVDERHARLVAAAARVLDRAGWTLVGELTFSVYGERGSIDLVGLRPTERKAVITEAKPTLASWEETQRRFDVKVRLLPEIIQERYGWRPRIVGKVLVFEDTTTVRRRVARLGPLIRHSFPATSRQVRAWLRKPDQSIAGIWFLSVSHPRTPRRRLGSG